MRRTGRSLACSIAFLLVVATLVAPMSSRALAQASAYVPLDDIAYGYIDALMARGQLMELSALERPFTERAVRTALDSARGREPDEMMRSYIDALYAAVEKYDVRPGSADTTLAQEFHARGTGDLYLTAQTSGRRELMLADSVKGLRPGGAIRLVMSGGSVVGFVRVLIDSRLNVDPEFAGRKDRKINGRTEDGYVSGQWKFGELSFGRVGRNWGPPSVAGLMLGNYAYTYDHLYGMIGTPTIHFSTVIARLDNLVPPTGPEVQRFFSIHRLAIHLGRWDLAGSESYVYSGVSRGFEPTLANPFNIYGLSWRNEREDGNLGLGAEGALRTERFGSFTAQAFLDDLQIDRCNPNCQQPSSYAFTVGAEGLPVRGDQRAFASYTRVSNLAYRNKNPTDNYEEFGIGLGRGFSDYDEIRAGLDVAMLARTPLRLYVAHRRQGQGSYNDPFPTPAEYATTPGIFSGVVMGVFRAGLSGVTKWRAVELAGDVGLNRVTNDGHVAGATSNRFEGRIKATIEPRWSVNF